MFLTQAGSENTNPIIPPAWEATTLLASLVIAALFIAALISIMRNRKQTPVGTVLWILVVFTVPVLGPLLWFLTGQRSSQTANTVS
jgi:hypothetical protein